MLIHDRVLALLREKNETELPSLPFVYLGEVARPQRHPLCRFHSDDSDRFVWVEGDPNFIAVEGTLDAEEATLHEDTLKALDEGRVRKKIFPSGWVYGIGPEDVHRRESIPGYGEGAVRHVIGFYKKPSDFLALLI